MPRVARFWQVALGWRIRDYDEAEIARLAAGGLTPESANIQGIRGWRWLGYWL